MKERIIELLKTPKHQLLSFDEICQALNVFLDEEKDEIGKSLEELENEYVITHNKAAKFALLSYFNLYKGIIIIKEQGYGFLDTPYGNIKIDENNLSTSMNNDIVLVSLINKSTPLKGVVTKIISRSTNYLVGEVVKIKKKYYIKSLVNKITIWGISTTPLPNLIKKIVKVKIVKYYSYNSVAVDDFILIGDASDVGMDITTLVVESGVKAEFDKETLNEAKNIKQDVSLSDYKDRIDLTNELIFTIDGNDAKDFDDAIGLTSYDDGTYSLKVCIADVSEYVKEASPLDLEALQRGTSIYLPDRVIPMLPEALSNGICSLNEGVNRLVMVCDMTIDKNGIVKESTIYEAVIKSSHRLTYDLVNKILEDQDDTVINEYPDIYPTLLEMNKLAKKLYELRIKRGSFDFETSEIKLNLDELGHVESLSFRVRKSAEKLIEEFMILANEVVATTMSYLDVPFIYRVHDEPDSERLNLFLSRIKALKQDFTYKNKASFPKALQTFIKKTTSDESELEKTLKIVINMMLLRSMAKAKYLEENIGHFGLQSKCYTHFTSPIRRYPDLLVHRLVKTFLLNKKLLDCDPYTYYSSIVHSVSVSSTNSEKVAERLERDATDMKKCEYMEQFVGNVFEGIVSSIVGWGLYVTLDNTIEGLVRFENLPYDYYEVDEKKGIIYGEKKNNVFRLGDLVLVKLLDVNTLKHQINFKLQGKVKNEN